MEIDVLGTTYTLDIVDDLSKVDENLTNSSGATNLDTKSIVIEKDYWDIERNLLHELIHAFLRESGLDCNSDWARNEEIIDWFAIQIPKINREFDRITEEYDII